MEFVEGLPVKAVTMSDSIAELACAHAKAQAEVEGAEKGNTNPHFRSKYADLASVWAACRAALTKYGLSVVQFPDRRGEEIGVTTLLMHASGQWISGRISTVPGKLDPQSVGSCVTYLRRYALAAVAGVAPEDDDGEGAMSREPVKIAYITDAQRNTLDQLVTDTKTEWNDFLRFFDIDAIGQLPAKDFERAVRLLETKKKKAAVKA